jgi:hypothetical protein
MLVRVYEISGAIARGEDNIIMTYGCNKPASRLPPSRLPSHSIRLRRLLALALSVVACPVAGRSAENPPPIPPAHAGGRPPWILVNSLQQSGWLRKPAFGLPSF